MKAKLPKHRRMLVLTEGQLGLFTAKTAASVLRYRHDDVVAIVDSTRAGQPAEQFIPWAKGVPIVGSVAEAATLGPDALLIGVATMGGHLPDAMRQHVVHAIEGGLDIISGLHVMLADDGQFGALAARHGVRIWDVRDTDGFATVGRRLAADLPVKRVLTVGTDCVVGKMVAALELTAAATRAGWNAAFVPTGQTGIMIAEWGLSVDRVISDFVNGAAEWLVQQVADRQICFVEGQGSIAHPGYSAVTVGMMHGCCPDAIIMCHRPGRDAHIDLGQPVVPLVEQIDMVDKLASMVYPTTVVGLTMNTGDMPEDEANRAVEDAAAQTGLPAVDVIRHGCDPLIDALRKTLDLP